MSDLLKQAEALDGRASIHESAAKNNSDAAAQCRAEAAKLREQAREPLRCWGNVTKKLDVYAYPSVNKAIYYSSADAGSYLRCAVPMVEVRPVRITHEQVKNAFDAYICFGAGYPGIREAMTYAINLAGLKVEK